MRTLMITKVKNEADIIEFFLRYHSNIFDCIVVIDNGSLDGTYEIVNKLIEEGLNIELINEAHNDFDAFRLANQYTVDLIEKYDAEYVIYMDADELLITQEGKQPIGCFSNFDCNKVHIFKWRTYIYTGQDIEMFSLEHYQKYRKDEEETFKKIMVPSKLIKDKLVVVSAGNHSVSSPYDIEEEYHEELKFAHFPVRSMHQRKKQITLNMLDMMANPNVSLHTGSHWKKMYKFDEIDLVEESIHYAFYEGDKIVEGGLHIENMNNKYFNLIRTDLERILIEHSEIQALKIKKNRMKTNVNHLQSIVVWGTGKYADLMVDRIDDSFFIELYVDSNIDKCFSVFHDRMVISPEKLRFFSFSKIIIATPQNEKEIREQIKQILPSWDKEKIYSIDTFVVNGYRNKLLNNY